MAVEEVGVVEVEALEWEVDQDMEVGPDMEVVAVEEEVVVVVVEEEAVAAAVAAMALATVVAQGTDQAMALEMEVAETIITHHDHVIDSGSRIQSLGLVII